MTGHLRLGFLFVIITLFLSLLFLLNKGGVAPLLVPESTSVQAPDYVLEDFSAIRTDENDAGYKMLLGKKMVHYPEDDSAELEQPRLITIEPGKPPVQLKADHARMSAEGEDIYLSGNVVIIRNAGKGRGETILTTSLLHLIPDQDIARTDKPVEIIETNATIRAIGMEMNNRTGTTQLLSQVKVVHDKKR
jgi:lipopolysaccharide export system protein LptC